MKLNTYLLSLALVAVLSFSEASPALITPDINDANGALQTTMASPRCRPTRYEPLSNSIAEELHSRNINHTKGVRASPRASIEIVEPVLV